MTGKKKDLSEEEELEEMLKDVEAEDRTVMEHVEKSVEPPKSRKRQLDLKLFLDSAEKDEEQKDVEIAYAVLDDFFIQVERLVHLICVRRGLNKAVVHADDVCRDVFESVLTELVRRGLLPNGYSSDVPRGFREKVREYVEKHESVNGWSRTTILSAIGRKHERYYKTYDMVIAELQRDGVVYQDGGRVFKSNTINTIKTHIVKPEKKGESGKGGINNTVGKDS